MSSPVVVNADVCPEDHDRDGDGDGRQPGDREGGRRQHVTPHRVAVAVVAAAAFTVVLALHGFLPGMSQPTVQAHLASGAIDCIRDRGLLAWSISCDAVGLPAGQPLLSGVPQTYLGVVISYLPGVDTWTAHVLVDVVCDAVGFAGMCLLCRRLGASALASVLAAFGYLGSLSIVYINGFAGTFNSFVLLPFAIWVTVLATDVVASAPRRWWPLPLLTATALVMAFTDGYGFVMMAATSAILWAGWALTAQVPTRRRLLGLAYFAVSVIGAASLYVVAQPAGVYGANVPMDVFRAMGADVVTFLVPQPNLWWARVTGINKTFGAGWGDQSAYRSNYVGLGLVALSTLALVVHRRCALIVSLGIAAVTATILALGPSLKLNDMRYSEAARTANPYYMPADEATIGLPTTLLYQHVPGLDDMRATYRWIVLVVLVVSALGAVAVSWIWRRRRPVLAVALALVAFVEVVPHVPSVLRFNEAMGRQLVAFRTGPAIEFDELTADDELVLLLPAGNDFLANDLVPHSDVRSFNVGIDKNAGYARASWPHDVLSAVDAYGTQDARDAVAAVLVDSADAVIFPYFNLRDNAQSWPPAPADIERYRAVAAPFTTDPRFEAVDAEWFLVVRPKEST